MHDGSCFTEKMADSLESKEEESRAVGSDDDSFDLDSLDSESSEDEKTDRIKTTRQREYNDERIDKSLSEITGENVRRYANKAGDFVTGFDVTSEEHKAKRELRAKRFGIQKNDDEEMMEVDLPNNTLESDVRPEALHIIGVDEMSTQDLFTYFQEFQPGSIEWLTDTSCNVVWLDPNTARRALLAMSKPEDRTEPEHEKPAEDMPNEEEDDFLNLEVNTEDKETGELERPPIKSKPSPVRFESEETGEVTTEKPATQQSATTLRIAIPHPKAKQLLLRYATKDDKKLPGAANRSKYYIKYGNPNFGGMRGLISRSMKRKIREGTVIPGKRKRDTGRSLVSYTDLDVFSDSAPPSVKKSKPQRESFEDEVKEEDERQDEEEEDEVDSEIEQMELELEQLTRPKETKKRRGMYADEVEEQIKSIRNQQGMQTNDLKVVLDARQRIESKLKQRLGPTSSADSDNDDEYYQNFTVIIDPRQQTQEEDGDSDNDSEDKMTPDLRTKLMNRQTSKRMLENMPLLSIQVSDD
ncbi:nuclear cap-binding protein subunit 3-like [Ptychodera flava]|uniref:nuclear cap-binding protein subunit 3-like n=1 Tax=Ptychodera flava TaxID=63121 RepID=UPI00396A904C